MLDLRGLFEAIKIGQQLNMALRKRNRQENPRPVFKLPEQKTTMNVEEIIEEKTRRAAEAKFPEINTGPSWEQYENAKDRNTQIYSYLSGAMFAENLWIPVSEYPLEDYQNVLLGSEEDGYVTFGYKGFGKFYDGACGDPDTEIFPTHWKPLPTIKKKTV